MYEITFIVDEKGIPGGSIGAIKRSYNLKVKVNKDRSMTLTGDYSDIRDYAEDHDVAHLIQRV